MLEFIDKMPKVELHCHLDGSLSINTASKILNIDREILKRKMQANSNCTSLREYLKKFDIPISIMQTEEELELASIDLIKQLRVDNVIYAEIRFAPIFHTKEGLDIEQVVKSVLKGFENTNIKINLILCCMRGSSMEDNLKTIQVAKKFLNKGVVAIDLAGDELNYPNELYKYIFDMCDRLDIPFTIHSGESDGKRSIMTALLYKTKRIGHGINVEDDMQLINELIKQNITLEICPISNLQTKAVSDLKTHPIYKLYKMGVNVTVNTDNRTVSNTNLIKEYKLLYSTFDFNKEDFISFNLNAIEGSFMTKEEKEEIKRIYLERIKNM